MKAAVVNTMRMNLDKYRTGMSILKAGYSDRNERRMQI